MCVLHFGLATSASSMGGLLAAQNAPRGVPYVGPSMQQNKLFVYFWLMVMGGSWESTYIEGITVSAVEV
jgi:hypothetical protein